MRQPSSSRPNPEPEVQKSFLEKSFPSIYALMRVFSGSGAKSRQRAASRRADTAQQLRGRLVTSGVAPPADESDPVISAPLDVDAVQAPAPEVQPQAPAPVSQQPADTALV